MAEHTPRERGIGRRPRILDYLGAGYLSEEEAEALAYETVRELRNLSYHHPEGPAPDPGEVRSQRESRQRRESHQRSEG
jgi:hypothetical protein